MAIKRFRMFAGPNGSGKSTLIREIAKNYNMGYFINADEIKRLANGQNYIKLEDFLSKPINNAVWYNFIEKYQNDLRLKDLNEILSLDNNIFVFHREIDSYQAALIATFFRENLLSSGKSFSFETVMSHPSKVDFLQKAKENGFKTYLYFICTQDPEINKLRVINRVSKGGHAVDEEKIVNRYFRSLGLLFQAFNNADRAFVIDSTFQGRNIILEKREHELLFHTENVPEWVAIYLNDKYELL